MGKKSKNRMEQAYQLQTKKRIRLKDTTGTLTQKEKQTLKIVLMYVVFGAMLAILIAQPLVN